LLRKLGKSLRPPGRKKRLTAEYAEIAELFIGKDKRNKSFYGYGLLFAFPTSGDEDERMNEEEAESAEIVPGKSLGRLDLPGKVGKRGAFRRASWR
jgi:hypothetical protein